MPQDEVILHGEFEARPFRLKGWPVSVGWIVTMNGLPDDLWSCVVPTREDAIRTMTVLSDEYHYIKES